jgi:hypothetical protein
MVHFQLKKEIGNLEEPVVSAFILCTARASTRVHDDLHAKDDVPHEEYDAGLRC